MSAYGLQALHLPANSSMPRIWHCRQNNMRNYVMINQKKTNVSNYSCLRKRSLNNCRRDRLYVRAASMLHFHLYSCASLVDFCFLPTWRLSTIQTEYYRLAPINSSKYKRGQEICGGIVFIRKLASDLRQAQGERFIRWNSSFFPLVGEGACPLPLRAATGTANKPVTVQYKEQGSPMFMQ